MFQRLVGWVGGVWGEARGMRSASIRRIQEERKKYANCVWICVWVEERRKRERGVSSKEKRENDRRGWRKGKERLRKTTPERLRAEPAAPSKPAAPLLILLPPCVLCHGYQTGLPMQPVNVFFSSRSELGTNVSRSVSWTINVNCPGMHKHTEGRKPGNTEPSWLHVSHRVTFIYSSASSDRVSKSSL